MTVSELAKYFADRKFFTDPDQEVRFVLSSEDVPLEKGARLKLRGSVAPERGEAVVSFCPAPMRKFMFSLRFEATPVIEAHTVEEAEKIAFEMMNHVGVKTLDTDAIDESFVEQEPYFLQEE